jgi:hypothetical protein
VASREHSRASTSGAAVEEANGEESRAERTARARCHEGWRRKGGTQVRRAPFIAAQGGGRRAARWQNQGRQSAVVTAVGTASARSGRRRLDSEAYQRAPRGFTFFELSKPAET